MEFRLINDSTLEQIKGLWSYCFEPEDSSFFQWYFKEYALKQNKIVGGFSENTLATMVHLNPYVLKLRGEEHKIKYLVGVATDPSFRGQHVMGELLTTTFNLLRAAGQKFVILEPINAGIYTPYGFAYTYLRQKYSMPLVDLTIPYVDYDLIVERIPTLTAQTILRHLYQQVMLGYDSYVERTDLNWQNMLQVAADEGLETVVVRENATKLGYALYSRKDGTINIQEMQAVNESAYRRMLAYFRSFAGSYEKLSYLAAPDDLTYLDFKQQDNTPQLHPFMMSRIINVEKILEGLSIPDHLVGTEFIIYIKDDFMSLNNAYAKVTLSKAGVVLKPTVDIPDLTMDITTFTQLYFGTYSALHLYKKGRILGQNPKLVEVLDELLPKQSNFINEYF